MKEYMLLMYSSEEKLNQLPHEKMMQVYEKFGEWVSNLKSQNRYISSDALTANRKTLKNSGFTDGPFSESKEVLNGYFLIKAENLEDAIQVSKSHPSFLYDGIVEVVELQGMK